MLVFIFCMPAYAQKIQYSRHTVKMPYADDVQLVPNINGNHHLLRLSVNKKPTVYVFNNQLQLQTEAIIDLKLQENLETRIVPFSDHYFFYTHTQKAATHSLYKVGGDGLVSSLTKAFQQVVDSVLNKSSAPVELVNQNEKLFAIAHVYYDEIKKIESTIVELTGTMQVARVWETTFDFNIEQNKLQQTILAGNNLLVLTSGSDEDYGHSLNLVKINLATGRSMLKAFRSERNGYSNASFRILPGDSSILLQATLDGGRTRGQQSGFISHLTSDLEELSPLAILQWPFSSNQARYFLLSDQGYWLNFSNNYFRRNRSEELIVLRHQTQTTNQTSYSRQRYSQTIPTLPHDAQVMPYPNRVGSLNMENLQPASNRRRLTSSLITPQKNIQSIVRFTVLNNQFKAIGDSVAQEHNSDFGIQPRPFAQFSVNNKTSLFLIQNFTETKNALLMVGAEKNGRIVSTNINVHYKYQYLLHQMQAVNNNSVLVPYTHKNQMGLIKISFN